MKHSQVVRRIAFRAAISMALPALFMAMIAWSVTGNRSTGGDPSVLEFDAFDDLFIAPWIIGIVGLIADLFIAARLRLDRRELATAFSAAALYGAMVGVALRVLTARTHGANIGGGLAIFTLVPTTVVVVVGAAVLLRRWEHASTPAAGAQSSG